MSNGTIAHYRFNRVGDVVRDDRRVAPTFGTDAYRQGDPLYTPHRSSKGRLQFRAERRDRRATTRRAA